MDAGNEKNRVLVRVTPNPDQALVEKVKLRVREERPLNISCLKAEDPELLDSVMNARPFLGWSSYVAAAGVAYDYVPHEFLDFLDCPICSKPFKHLGNHMLYAHEDSPESYGLPTLAEGSIISIYKDLRKKATNFPHWEAAWSKEYVADYFYHYYTASGSRKRRNHSFQTAIKRFWGGSHELCQILDLFCEQRNSVVYNSKDDVLQGIRSRFERGHSLLSSSLHHGDFKDFGLTDNALKYFPSWAEAVAASGVPVKVPSRPRSWDAASVEKAFRSALLSHGSDLRYTDLRKIDIGLTEAIRLHLGPYNSAKARLIGD